MWFGILTPGEHECRPVADPGVATLYCWNDIARMRIDGPADDVASGLRMLRGTMRRRDQEPHEPRCFVCGMPYGFPDAEAARAAAEDWAPAPPDPSDGEPPAFDPSLARAIFALVHLEDDVRDIRDEEVLVVVPSARLATLVPLDAVDRMLEILAVALAGAEPERCEGCDAIAPGGARVVGGMSREERRAAARADRKDQRGCGRHRRAA